MPRGQPCHLLALAGGVVRLHQRPLPSDGRGYPHSRGCAQAVPTKGRRVAWLVCSLDGGLQLTRPHANGSVSMQTAICRPSPVGASTSTHWSGSLRRALEPGAIPPHLRLPPALAPVAVNVAARILPHTARACSRNERGALISLLPVAGRSEIRRSAGEPGVCGLSPAFMA
jgi:hypothetical protein